MKVSDIIDQLYPKSKQYSLSKVHQELKELDEDLLLEILDNKSFPDFGSFKDSIEGERILFGIPEGLMILKSYSKDSILNIDKLKLSINESELERDENIRYLFYTRKYSLSKVFNSIQKMDSEILTRVIHEKPFPEFNSFNKSFKGKDTLFSVYDGLIFLKYYFEEKVYDLELPKINQKRINRSLTQSKNLLKKESDGLLGVSILKKKEPNNKQKTTVSRSIWTVKKK